MATTQTIVKDVKPNGKASALILDAHKNNMTLDGVVLTHVSIISTYLIHHGKSTYNTDKIHFFNKDGIVYTVGRGWLESKHSRRIGSIGFAGVEELKKKIKPSFKDVAPFFVSIGKASFSNELEAELYIPIEYLEAYGYQEIVEVDDSRFNTNTRKEVIVGEDLFRIHVAYTNEKKFDNVKAELIKRIEAATTREEVEKAWKDLNYSL